MNIEYIKEKEKELQKIIDAFYEELGKEFIGKFYKKVHENKDAYHGDHDYVILLYIYGTSRRSLSGIEFDDANILRRGIFFESMILDWEEITKEEFLVELKKYINYFHFNDFMFDKKEVEKWKLEN